MHKCAVEQVNDNGTFDVKYEDGEVEANKPILAIRKIKAPPTEEEAAAAAEKAVEGAINR